MVINDASDCTDGNEVWDEENGYCFGMMRLSDDGTNLEGGMNDPAFPLWEKYGMSKLYTYRNTLECWKANGNRMGATKPNPDPKDTSLPQCLFGMEVKKGSWKDYGNGKHRLVLDEAFPNFPDGELESYESIYGGYYWPKCDGCYS